MEYVDVVVLSLAIAVPKKVDGNTCDGATIVPYVK